MCLMLDQQLQDDPAVLGTFSPNDLMIRFPADCLPACPSPDQFREFHKAMIRTIMPHEYYHYLQLLGTVAGLRRLLFRVDVLKNRMGVLRAIARANSGVLPFPAADWINSSPEAARFVSKKNFVETKLIYYEGGFDFDINRLSTLTGRTYTDVEGIECVTPVQLNGHKLDVPLLVLIRSIAGCKHARALGLRDVIEGTAYCVSLIRKNWKTGQASVITQVESDSSRPEMAIYLSLMRLLPLYIHDKAFWDSDLNSLEALIILGELSLMLDFYMLNVTPELFLALLNNEEEAVTLIESNDCNPACYFTMLIRKLGEVWRTVPVPVDPSDVGKFCDLLLGGVHPGLTLENLVEGAEKSAEFLFGSLPMAFLPQYQHVITERVQKTIRLRRTLKYPILGLNMLDDSQLQICYRDNLVPYSVNLTMCDPSFKSSTLPEGHLLGSLSELHKLTRALETGESLRCELLPEGSGCPVPRTPFCEGKNIQEVLRERPTPTCVRLHAMYILVSACAK